VGYNVKGCNEAMDKAIVFYDIDFAADLVMTAAQADNQYALDDAMEALIDAVPDVSYVAPILRGAAERAPYYSGPTLARALTALARATRSC
jgi:hypothetical protein